MQLMASCAGLKRRPHNRRAVTPIGSAAIGAISKSNYTRENITMAKGTVVVVGATCELGKALAKHYADKGHCVVVTSRDLGRAQAAAREIGGDCVPVAVDLATPHPIAATFADVGDVLHLALVGLHRDENKVRDYNIDEALKLVT